VARATWEQADAKIVVQALQAISDGAWPLVIAGDVGAGKSCLAALLLSLVPDRSARMFDCSTLLAHVMECRTSPSGATLMPLLDGGSVDRTESQILRWIDQMSLLVLDDVGVRALTEPQSEALLRIVNLRHGKPLIVTTNIKPENLADLVGPRIYSRLRPGTVIWMGGEDLRKAVRT
jgi:DNA replication protein DnaC